MKNSNVVIIILTVLVVGMGSYLMYDKLVMDNSNEKVNNNEENSNQGSNNNDNFTLNGTIFEVVNENNFRYIEISKYEDPEHPGDAMYYSANNEKTKKITSWNDSKALFNILNKQSYTETSFSGIGFDAYQIDIVYKENNEDKTISIQPDIVFGSGVNTNDSGYSVTATDEVKTELLNLVNSLFNN